MNKKTKQVAMIAVGGVAILGVLVLLKKRSMAAASLPDRDWLSRVQAEIAQRQGLTTNPTIFMSPQLG